LQADPSSEKPKPYLLLSFKTLRVPKANNPVCAPKSIHTTRHSFSPFKKATSAESLSFAVSTMGAEGIPLSGTPPGMYRPSPLYLPSNTSSSRSRSRSEEEERLDGETALLEVTTSGNVNDRLVTPEADSSAPIPVDFQSLLLPASPPYAAAATPTMPATTASYPYPSYPPLAPPPYSHHAAAYAAGAAANACALPYATATQGSATSFPEKLHQILNLAEYEGWMDVVSFAPHGRAFCIHEVRVCIVRREAPRQGALFLTIFLLIYIYIYTCTSRPHAQPRRFVARVLPRFFKQTKLTSFQRQLNLYGFKRIPKGLDHGSYYHPCFVRGQPYLAKDIKRCVVKSKAVDLSPPAPPPEYV
jgi:hypothetical protein